MEKKIISEINRSLNIMGLYDNLILENVTSETVKSIGKIALQVFKNNISKNNNDPNTLKDLLKKYNVADSFLDENDKFWKYVRQGQEISRFTFDNDNEVYDLISQILKIDAGYFSIIFRNILKKDGEVINFDKFIREANSTKFDDEVEAYFFLRKNVDDVGGINDRKLSEYFFEYLEKYKSSEVFVNDLPKFRSNLSVLLKKYKLSRNWGLTIESIIMASKTNQDRLITNIKITINNASKELTNSSTSGGSNDEKIYNDLYLKIERYFQAFYMKENNNHIKLLESFQTNAPKEVKELIDNIINAISSPTDDKGVKKIYTIIDALAPEENRSVLKNIKLKFGYGIADSIDDLPKKPIPKDVTDVVEEVTKKSGYTTLFKKAIIKASTSAPVKTMAQSYAFGVLPNRKLIVKYLSDAKIFSDSKLAGPAASKYIRYLRAYFTIQIYSLARKVIIYGLLPILTGAAKAAYESDTSVRIRNLLNRNYNLVMGRNYTEIEYTRNNFFANLVIYGFKDFKYLFQSIVSSNLNSFDSFMSATIKNIILPAYILSLTEAFIWKKVLYPIVTDLTINRGFESFDYSEFIDRSFNNEMRRNQEELDNNNPELRQAGGTEVTVSTPTWSYGQTMGQTRQLIINFDKSKIKSLLINGRPLEVTRLRLNSNNKPAINIPINYDISTIKLTDNNNRNYNLTKE